MIRGLQKQMIQLKTPKSKYFEVVLFVLRPGAIPKKEREGEMVREAQRLLAEGRVSQRGAERLREGRDCSKKQKAALFLSGALCGGALCALMLLAVALLR